MGDGGVATGFARVTESVLSRLTSRYEVHHLAANFRGDPHSCGWKLYPATLGGDPFGVGRLPEIMRKVKPDVVWTINDAWIQAQYLEQIWKTAPQVAVATYTPVDAGPVDPDWLEPATRVKSFVVYTEFGKREVLKAAGARLEPLLRVIPHGVCAKTFHEIPDLAPGEAKRRIGIAEAEGEGSFVVLNANRNQERKRIDLTLLGFAEFARGKPPGVKLLMHMGQTDLGWNLIKLSRRLGIEERLILTGAPDGSKPSIGDADLNLIYNACDIGINTSGGEGWGLAALEHAAAGKAQIVPRHSACSEIWEGAAVLLDVHDRGIQTVTLTELWFTRPPDIARALETLYASPDLRDDVARRCQAVARSEEYSWDRIAQTWDQVFSAALNAGAA